MGKVIPIPDEESKKKGVEGKLKKAPISVFVKSKDGIYAGKS